MNQTHPFDTVDPQDFDPGVRAGEFDRRQDPVEQWGTDVVVEVCLVLPSFFEKNRMPAAQLFANGQIRAPLRGPDRTEHGLKKLKCLGSTTFDRLNPHAE